MKELSAIRANLKNLWHGFHWLHCPLFYKCGSIYEMEANPWSSV